MTLSLEIKIIVKPKTPRLTRETEIVNEIPDTLDKLDDMLIRTKS